MLGRRLGSLTMAATALALLAAASLLVFDEAGAGAPADCLRDAGLGSSDSSVWPESRWPDRWMPAQSVGLPSASTSP